MRFGDRAVPPGEEGPGTGRAAAPTRGDERRHRGSPGGGPAEGAGHDGNGAPHPPDHSARPSAPGVRFLDLQLDLDLHRRHGRSEELAAALRRAIDSGRLRPGTRLPSTRGVAQELGLARGTVTSAYRRLVLEGRLEAEQGSGTRVTLPRSAVSPDTSAGPGTRNPWRWNLRPAMPDVTLFPRTAWVRATQRVLREASAEALDYGDPRGRPELRQALADYLGRARGVVTRPDRIVVCHGFTQAIGLLARVLAGHGAGRLAIEDPSYPLFREIIRMAELTAHPVEVDEHGLRPELLDAEAVLVTPIHQYPLGVSLSEERRGQLLAWARATDSVIVEDDYDGEFQYGRRRIGTLQALEPSRVIYAGTTSKTLAPGLRLAWLVLPPDWVEPVTAAKRIADQHSAALTQMVLAELITSGAYDRHVRHCRSHYRRRREQLGAALAQGVPQVRLLGENAGLHAVVHWSQDGPSEREVLHAARHESLAVSGLGEYCVVPGSRPPGLVVGYATPPRHGYAGALESLTRTLRRAFGTSGNR
jgi:GntR family transcriptional regulator/MocR family aminotransferase